VSGYDIASIEAVIAEAQAGRPYILVDAEDRENEGDVIVPAQFATAEQINFMAKHARGLFCLAITQARARQLRLPPALAAFLLQRLPRTPAALQEAIARLDRAALSSGGRVTRQLAVQALDDLLTLESVLPNESSPDDPDLL